MPGVDVQARGFGESGDGRVLTRAADGEPVGRVVVKRDEDVRLLSLLAVACKRLVDVGALGGDAAAAFFKRGDVCGPQLAGLRRSVRRAPRPRQILSLRRCDLSPRLRKLVAEIGVERGVGEGPAKTRFDPVARGSGALESCEPLILT